MKKIMVLFAAAMLLFGFSGQAMASFAAGDLIQVVYQAGGASEMATDLGSGYNFTSAYTGPAVNFTTNPFATAGTGVFSTANWGNLNVAYFISDGTNTNAWVSGPSTGLTDGARKGPGFNTAAGAVMNAYNALGTGAQGSMLQSGLSSYYTRMNSAGLAIGSMSAFIPAGTTEMNLLSLATPGSYVDQYIYFFGNATASSAQPGEQVYDIRTFSDGTSEIQTTPTPVPPSVLLFGTGLLGLVGIRRKLA
jgi:hypothetical protein